MTVSLSEAFAACQALPHGSDRFVFASCSYSWTLNWTNQADGSEQEEDAGSGTGAFVFSATNPATLTASLVDDATIGGRSGGWGIKIDTLSISFLNGVDADGNNTKVSDSSEMGLTISANADVNVDPVTFSGPRQTMSDPSVNPDDPTMFGYPTFSVSLDQPESYPRIIIPIQRPIKFKFLGTLP